MMSEIDSAKLRSLGKRLEHLLHGAVRTPCAIALRGSYARGAATPYSDLDLVLFAEDLQAVEEALPSIKSSLSSAVEMRISFVLDPFASSSHPLYLRVCYFLSLPFLRHLCGSARLFGERVAVAQRALVSLTWTAIAEQLAECPFLSRRRRDPGSDPYWHLKGGFGGLIDYQSIEVFERYFARPEARVLSPARLEQVRMAQGRLDRARRRLHESAQAPIDDLRAVQRFPIGDLGFERLEMDKRTIGELAQACFNSAANESLAGCGGFSQTSA